jgi:hypothetical protein
MAAEPKSKPNEERPRFFMQMAREIGVDGETSAADSVLERPEICSQSYDREGW